MTFDIRLTGVNTEGFLISEIEGIVSKLEKIRGNKISLQNEIPPSDALTPQKPGFSFAPIPHTNAPCHRRMAPRK
jgi:hypothetical protein